jgi:hypothetical protein
MQEFDVDAQACERDVIEFFEELAANDLIVIVDSPSDPVRPAARA